MLDGLPHSEVLAVSRRMVSDPKDEPSHSLTDGVAAAAEGGGEISSASNAQGSGELAPGPAGVVH